MNPMNTILLPISRRVKKGLLFIALFFSDYGYLRPTGGIDSS